MIFLEKRRSAQAAANKRWESKNKEYSNYLKSRNASRSFIRRKATSSDLQELRQLISTREKELSEECN